MIPRFYFQTNLTPKEDHIKGEVVKVEEVTTGKIIITVEEEATIITRGIIVATVDGTSSSHKALVLVQGEDLDNHLKM